MASFCEKGGDVFLLRLVQRVVERADDSFRRLHRQLRFYCCRACGREAVSKHRQPALRLLPSGFVLQHVPVLRKNSVRDSYDVRGDPGARPPVTGEAPVKQDIFAVGDGHGVLVPQCGRCRSYEIEESISSRSDVCAVLDVVG
jgi:hypothetical protein